jgi:hypothetical protein
MAVEGRNAWFGWRYTNDRNRRSAAGAPRRREAASVGPEADLGKVDRPDLRRIGETATLARGLLAKKLLKKAP